MANPQPTNQQPNQKPGFGQQNPQSQKPGFNQPQGKDAENKFRPKAEEEEEGSEKNQRPDQR